MSMWVLIVPLWNWNDREFGTRESKDPRLNRTFMELKLGRWNKGEGNLKCLNRTFMELKLVFIYGVDDAFWS